MYAVLSCQVGEGAYDKCLEIVAAASTIDMPNGSVEEAWNLLMQKFEPKYVTRKINLQDEFTGNKITPGASADKWIQNMRTMRKQLKDDFGVDMTDEDFVTRLYRKFAQGTLQRPDCII